jgi:hypothetical protein
VNSLRGGWGDWRDDTGTSIRTRSSHAMSQFPHPTGSDLRHRHSIQRRGTTRTRLPGLCLGYAHVLVAYNRRYSAALAPWRVSRGGGGGWRGAAWRVSRRLVERARAAGTADPGWAGAHRRSRLRRLLVGCRAGSPARS